MMINNVTIQSLNRNQYLGCKRLGISEKSVKLQKPFLIIQPDAYLGYFHKSMMKHYVEMVNGLEPLTNFRSSRLQRFFKTDVLKNCAIFTEKKPVMESLFNKVAGLQAFNFIQKRLQHMFSCEYCEDFNNRFFIEQFHWPLL